MTNRISFAAGTAVAFMLLICLVACESPGPKLKTVKLKIDWQPTAEYYGIFLAKHNGWFKEAGFDVTVVPGQGAPLVAAELAAGSVLVGTTTSGQILSKISSGHDFAMAVPLVKFNPAGIISLASKPLNSLQDLRGRRLGVNVASMTYKQYLYVMSESGIATQSVEEIPIGWGGPSFLLEGRVDAVLHYITNLGVQLRAKGHKISHIMFGRDLDPPLHSYGTVLCFSDIQPMPGGLDIQEMKKLAQIVLRGYREGASSIGAAVEALAAAEPTLDREKAKMAIETIIQYNRTSSASPGNIDQWVPANEQDRARFRQIYQLLD